MVLIVERESATGVVAHATSRSRIGSSFRMPEMMPHRRLVSVLECGSRSCRFCMFVSALLHTKAVAAATALQTFRPFRGNVPSVMNYRVVLYPSDEGFAVACPDLPGCWSQGATEEEALAN